MFLQTERRPTVDNPRGYPAEIVDELEQLLVSGGSARPDPARPGFYDLQGIDRTFFIHISRRNGTVMLLATWPRRVPVPSELCEQDAERV